ncbi:R3H and coiled-coil domain-containing protein 1 [Seriola dumerili]|uniref:R3H domain and coiled-coil containing 1 n=1 Tax=Seriola dumerili TaxID=41447 RepID=A0A3B4VM71_SERDU|nr:R3H and coiled-coil domain-containing protein 1 [Seriola dumerili]XP_022600731.1 R3H and coiled-coil domain-containing protein 1 [Seriola dumerili]
MSTLAFPCFDGIYLPKQENEFVHHVMDELETYQQKSNQKSVLLFPCLPSRLRYLIHRTIEDLPELTTFSVGESWCRRVVVCHSELRGEIEEDSDLESNNSLCEEPLRSKEEMDGFAKPKTSIPSRSRGPKRPDKPLYMPRAARERLSSQNSQGPTAYKEKPSPASSSCSHISSSSDSCSCYETSENTKPSSTSRQESPPSVTDGILNHISDSSARCPQEERQKLVLRLHETEPLVWDQTVSCFTEMTLEEDVKDKEDFASVPYSSQIEDTSTDTDDVTEEIKAHLKEAVSFSIEHVHNDYSIYENVCISADEFRHVIEIYDFPPIFKTDDLLDAFTEYSDGGMKIKWVDNTHALGVFSNESAALHALSICHPLLKARALSEGSKKAKGKAIRRAEFIQPVKERPRTDCAVARRMVTRALGLPGRGRVQRY